MGKVGKSPIPQVANQPLQDPLLRLPLAHPTHRSLRVPACNQAAMPLLMLLLLPIVCQGMRILKEEARSHLMLIQAQRQE